MTTKIVIDASVVLKWVLRETYSEQAIDLLNERNKYSFIAPDILVTEVANALWKRVKIGEMQIEEAKAFHDAIFVEDIIDLHPSANYMERAFDLANNIQHNAIYDCVYLAMAESFHCNFITADHKLIKNANKNSTSSNLRFIANLH